jgi:transcriptional regulator with XRE-family HTH domain
MAGKRHRLIQRRTKLGFTQERLAELLEVDTKLSRHLKVSLDDLDEILADVSEDDPAPDGRLTYALHNPTNIAAAITTAPGPNESERRASQIPDRGPNKVPPGMEDDECRRNVGNTALSSRLKRRGW